MRYLLEISYSGTAYHGWQIQPNAISVQEVLEDRISKILHQPTNIVGCGRTDTGVHALQSFAHFDIDFELIPDFVHRLNAFLPKDIAVRSCVKVNHDFHARFDALERRYRYQIIQSKNPFLTDQAWLINSNFPDINLMNQAANQLTKFQDFTAFAKLHSDNKTNLCDLRFAHWQWENDILIFEIGANRFLRNMVRAIVGTLIEVGKGKLSMKDFIQGIESKERSFVANTAPAHGLYLSSVIYPQFENTNER